jgi:acyl-coenzyme A thioesterase PaaI-like protein
MLMKLFRRMGNTSPAWLTRILFNCWPPFIGAGIHIKSVSADYRAVRVTLKRRWYNKNYVGTQFGGSIYAMTDPFYMWLIMNNLGQGYYVWDKAASVDFISPGKTELIADFVINEAILADVRQHTDSGEKYIFDLPVTIFDTEGNVVAKVIKTLYVRKKKDA